MSRRWAIVSLGTAASLLGLGLRPRRVIARPSFAADPFTLGVASGDPAAGSVVLWTRLAPDPLNGGGMPDADVEVTWRVARDEGFRDEVASGRVLALRDFGHSVHAVPVGLAPDSWYFYRFEAGDAASPVGRARTLPATGTAANRLRFAYVSCQNDENGYFAPFNFIAEDNLDFVIHLGDYIYEYAQSQVGAKEFILPYRVVRQHNGPAIATIDDYRNRYALYKSDPNLMAAHAACPWFTTWDDHEVDNDWAGSVPSRGSKLDLDAFTLRRAAAFQAYFEHMPVRPTPGTRLYRDVAFGDLASFFILDTRQYRTPQPCGSTFPGEPDCPTADDEATTMTGPAQEAWLLDGLGRSGARWNVLAQQTISAPYDYGAPGHPAHNMDQWDGYRAQRSRILDFLAARRPRNPMIITGDWHSFWANDIKAKLADPASGTIATEYVGSSISSACPWREKVAEKLDQNPHVRYFEGDRRGYVRTTVTPEAWRADFMAVDDPFEPDAGKVRNETLRSFVTEDGRPGVQNA